MAYETVTKVEFMEFQQVVMADALDINIGVPRWYTIRICSSPPA
jgi:hypothetical protein